jgi:hypothetical protein
LVGSGRLTPSEFWGCDPVEVWWLVEAAQPVKMYGDMTEGEVAAIYAETYGEPDE